MLISGSSGSGKTALVQHFLDGLESRELDVILTGQCYQQESVPYKVFDGLVDRLGHFLLRLGPHELQALLPHDADSLARVFPVLRHVTAFTPPSTHEAPDPRELRRRAFGALRGLLAGLGARRPLILFIDDLQWGDRDSLALLAELLRPPDPPLMLLLGSYRAEEAATSPFLQGLLAGRDKMRSALVLRELTLEPLGQEEAHDLASRLLGKAEDADSAAALIARESGGNPFYIYELAQQSHATASAPTGGLTLDALIGRRFALLPREAQRLLEVLATAGRPLGQAEACRAAGLDVGPLAVLSVLRSQRLVRGTGMGDDDLLTTWHDRVRTAVAARLPPDVTADCHRRLAEALVAAGRDDPEALAVHYRGAGERVQAADCYERAAGRAAAALAFEHAARLYQQVLELGMRDATDARRLRELRADALANAGRGAEAAPEYLALAVGAPADTALDLRRKASGQYLISGHVAEGVAAARTVLTAVGMGWPATPFRALLALLASRFRLWCRGLRFTARAVDKIPPAALRRIDTSWSVAVGLSGLDPIRGAYFQAYNLLLALRRRAVPGRPCFGGRGVPRRHGRNARRPPHGCRPRSRRRGRPVRERPPRHRPGGPRPRHLELPRRRLAGGCRGLRRAEALFRDRCLGVTWELNTASAFRLYAYLFAGRIADLARSCPLLMKEARDRGDLYAFAHLGTFVQPFVQLAAGAPDEARRELDEVMGWWSADEFFVQHANALLRQCEIDLYGEDSVSAAARVAAAWPAYSRSLILRVQHMRICAYHLHGRTDVAAGHNVTSAERVRAQAPARAPARRQRAGALPACRDRINSGPRRSGRRPTRTGRGRLRRLQDGSFRRRIAPYPWAAQRGYGEVRGRRCLDARRRNPRPRPDNGGVVAGISRLNVCAIRQIRPSRKRK